MPRAVGCGRGPCDRYLIVTSDGAGNLVPTLGIARDLRRDTPSAFTPKSAFPGGQVSEMVDMQTSARERVERPGSERVCATSSTSRGAITRRPEGKRGMIMSGPDDELPSGRRVIGLCQVDEMARFGPAVWSEQILSVSPASRQHCPTRDDIDSAGHRAHHDLDRLWPIPAYPL